MPRGLPRGCLFERGSNSSTSEPFRPFSLGTPHQLARLLFGNFYKTSIDAAIEYGENSTLCVALSAPLSPTSPIKVEGLKLPSPLAGERLKLPSPPVGQGHT